MRVVLASALLIFVVGCSSSSIKAISASEFHDYGSAPMEHTLYLGSDDMFHYFAWSSGKASGKWKVMRSEMSFETTWALSEGRDAPVVRGVQGNWQPYIGAYSTESAPNNKLQPSADAPAE